MKRLADAALAVDRDDLRFLLDLAGVDRIRLHRRFGAHAFDQREQAALGVLDRCVHAASLQSSTIFRQVGSVNAVV